MVLVLLGMLPLRRGVDTEVLRAVSTAVTGLGRGAPGAVVPAARGD